MQGANQMSTRLESRSAMPMAHSSKNDPKTSAASASANRSTSASIDPPPAPRDA
jgi:hypothetical protein